MILNEKKTTVAYRCPECGYMVRSMIGVFTLKGDMMRLKCSCGCSDMTMEYKDDKVSITVPCFVCPSNHKFRVSNSAFFGKDLLRLPCSFTGLDVVFVGKEEKVLEAIEQAEKDLKEMVGEDVSIYDLSARKDEQCITDPQIREIVTFVLQDLSEEGKIYCRCPEGEAGEYTAEILDEEIIVKCKKCGAAKVVPANSFTAAEAFLNAEHLFLE